MTFLITIGDSMSIPPDRPPPINPGYFPPPSKEFRPPPTNPGHFSQPSEEFPPPPTTPASQFNQKVGSDANTLEKTEGQPLLPQTKPKAEWPNLGNLKNRIISIQTNWSVGQYISWFFLDFIFRASFGKSTIKMDEDALINAKRLLEPSSKVEGDGGPDFRKVSLLLPQALCFRKISH